MIPVNAESRVITEYGRDPADSYAASLFRDVVNRIQGRFGQAALLGFDGARETSLGGYAQSPQVFQGSASRATTNVTTRNGAYPEISSGIVTGPYENPARRIFADRLARGQGF